MAEEKFLTIRLTADLHAELAQLADRNERTIAAEVRLAIKERVERETKTVTA